MIHRKVHVCKLKKTVPFKKTLKLCFFELSLVCELKKLLDFINLVSITSLLPWDFFRSGITYNAIKKIYYMIVNLLSIID